VAMVYRLDVTVRERTGGRDCTGRSDGTAQDGVTGLHRTGRWDGETGRWDGTNAVPECYRVRAFFDDVTLTVRSGR